MAGDWIKIEHWTPDKPEVFRMAERLGIDPDSVTGKLVRIWIWADQQTISGSAQSVTKALLDRVANHSGFADALIEAGWLESAPEGISFINFDRHNGNSAKNRAQNAKRASASRSHRDKCHAHTVTKAHEKRDLEKRREEKNINTEHIYAEPPKPIAPDGPSEAFRLFAATYPRWVGERDAWNAWQATVWQLVSERGISDADAEQLLLEAAQRFRDSPAGKDPPRATDDDFRLKPSNWLKGGHYADSDAILQRPNRRAEPTRGSAGRTGSKPALTRHPDDEAIDELFRQSSERVAETPARGVPQPAGAG